MKFSEKLQEMLTQGFDVSKEFVEKAGSKAKDISRQGVIQFEIMNLRSEAQKMSAHLGLIVYRELHEKNESHVALDTPGVLDTIERLNSINAEIESREAEISTIKHS